jgi:hypothetical protein
MRMARPSLAPIKMKVKGVATREMGRARALRAVSGRTRRSRDTRLQRLDLCRGQLAVNGPPGVVAP